MLASSFIRILSFFFCFAYYLFVSLWFYLCLLTLDFTPIPITLSVTSLTLFRFRFILEKDSISVYTVFSQYSRWRGMLSATWSLSWYYQLSLDFSIFFIVYRFTSFLPNIVVTSISPLLLIFSAYYQVFLYFICYHPWYKAYRCPIYFSLGYIYKIVIDFLCT